MGGAGWAMEGLPPALVLVFPGEASWPSIQHSSYLEQGGHPTQTKARMRCGREAKVKRTGIWDDCFVE